MVHEGLGVLIRAKLPYYTFSAYTSFEALKTLVYYAIGSYISTMSCKQTGKEETE